MGKLYQEYKEKLRKQDVVLHDAIEKIVEAMFKLETDEIERTVLVKNHGLKQRDRELFDAMSMNESSSVFKLIGLSVLHETKVPGEGLNRNSTVPQIRFLYDRFAHFLLAGELLNRIDYRARRPPSNRLQAAVEVIRVNLSPSQDNSVIFGALQRALWSLREILSAPDYSRCLQRVAKVDARGPL
jgi:hypothetical protein